MPSNPANPQQEYTGPSADAKAAAIDATLGSDDETAADVIWLLRYVTVRYGIRWPADPTEAGGDGVGAGVDEVMA